MFIKTFKKTISALIAVLMVLSVVPMGAFAAIWDGTNEPSFRGNSVVWSEETGAYVKDGTLSSSKTGAGAIILDHDGNYGKDADDKVYKTFDFTRTYEDYSGSGDFTLAGSSTQDLAREFSFAYDEAGTDGVLIGSYFRFFKNMNRNTSSGNSTYATDFLKVTTNAITFAGKTVSYEFKPHRWYNITMLFDTENKMSDGAANAGSYHYRAYVNGELVVDVPDYGTYYGTSTGRVIPKLNTVIYWDNLNAYAVDSSASADFTCTKTPAASLVSTASNVSVDEDCVIIPEDMTVAQLKGAISVASGTADIKIYDSAFKGELDDSAQALNATIVLTASSNDSDVYNTYTYYNTEKYVYKYDYLLDETGDYARGGTKTGDPLALLVTSDGLNGKTADDTVMVYTDATGNRYLQNYVYTKNPDYKARQKTAFEFQVMIPENSTGAEFAMWMPRGTEGTEVQTAVRSDGYYLEGNKIAEFIPGRWYTLAIAGAGATAYSDATPIEFDNTYEIYVNGTKVATKTLGDLSEMTSTLTGIHRARIRGGNAIGDYTPSLYWDNMRYTFEEYNPNYDKEAVVTGKIVDKLNKKLSVLEGTTIAQMKEAVSVPEDTNIRVYDAENNLISSDAQPLLDTYTVVFAAKNGTEMERAYSYYEVEYAKTNIALEILNNGETAGESYDADDVITVNADFANYDDAAHNVVLYVAQYKDGELIKLWSDDETVTNDGVSVPLTVSLTDIEKYAGTSLKVILWNVDNQSPYIVTKELNCSVRAE